MKFSDMTDKELIEIATDCYDSIYNIDCFGTSDLRNLNGAAKELEERGYCATEVCGTSTLRFDKCDDGDEDKA